MNKSWLVIGGVLVLGVLLVGGGVWWLQRRESGQLGTGGIFEGPSVVTPSPLEEEGLMVTPGPTTAVLPEEESEVTGNVKKIVVEGSSFKFSPNTIKVKKGETVELAFRSLDAIHDFNLDEFEAQTNQIGEGEEEVIEFTVNKVGTFEFYCSVANHRQMGMKGKFVVEP